MSFTTKWNCQKDSCVFSNFKWCGLRSDLNYKIKSDSSCGLFKVQSLFIVNSKCLEEYLAHSRCSSNIGWINLLWKGLCPLLCPKGFWGKNRRSLRGGENLGLGLWINKCNYVKWVCWTKQGRAKRWQTPGSFRGEVLGYSSYQDDETNLAVFFNLYYFCQTVELLRRTKWFFLLRTLPEFTKLKIKCACRSSGMDILDQAPTSTSFYLGVLGVLLSDRTFRVQRLPSLWRTKRGAQKVDFPGFFFLHQGLKPLSNHCTRSRPTGWLHLCSNRTQSWSSSMAPVRPHPVGVRASPWNGSCAHLNISIIKLRIPAERQDNRTYHKALAYETTCWHSCVSIIMWLFYATSPILWTDYSLPNQKLFEERAKGKLNRKYVSQQSSPNGTAQKSWKIF